MSKNKKHNKNYNGNGSQPQQPQIISTQGAIASVLAKAADAVKSTATAITLPELGSVKIDNFEKSEPEVKAEIERWLADITNTAKQLHLSMEDAQKREQDLARKEEAFIKRSDENKKRADDLARLEDEIKTKQAEIKKTESLNVDRERAFEARELEARSGFAKLNTEALGSLKAEIKVLEERRSSIQLEIHNLEQKKLDEESVTVSDFIQREAEIGVNKRKNEQDRVRLDAEWSELKREKSRIKKEAQDEVAEEIIRLQGKIQRTEEKLEKAHNDLDEANNQLEQYSDFADALAGRSVHEVLDDIVEYRKQISKLENQIKNSNDTQLKSENKMLRNERDNLKVQLDDVQNELADVKDHLQKLRLGVIDKESLEKEKRVLEKHNQVLSAKLGDLAQTVDDLTESQKSETPFRQMSWMDRASNKEWITERKASELNYPLSDVPDLKKFAAELQHRIAKAEDSTSLYFRLHDIRLLLAGLAMSQLHIMQGISGTGKTSLAKAFAKAMGGHCTDVSVQAGWRDRDDLLGHYNAFEKRFYERDCLQGLYRAQTDAYKDRFNIILLDEMNLSRPEQYFAEFLSALEKNDPKERLITLSEDTLPNAPKLFREGRKILVPENIWFIGTANHDETTNEFADKTYDRAHVMILPRHEERFEIKDFEKTSYSFSSLRERFDKAIHSHREEVKELLDELTTGPLTNALHKHFDIGWGNRFERQALQFIPVYMAADGKKEEALDHLLATRVFRRGKVTGRYDATIDDLNIVKDLLLKRKVESKESLRLIEDDIRRKGVS